MLAQIIWESKRHEATIQLRIKVSAIVTKNLSKKTKKIKIEGERNTTNEKRSSKWDEECKNVCVHTLLCSRVSHLANGNT